MNASSKHSTIGDPHLSAMTLRFSAQLITLPSAATPLKISARPNYIIAPTDDCPSPWAEMQTLRRMTLTTHPLAHPQFTQESIQVRKACPKYLLLRSKYRTSPSHNLLFSQNFLMVNVQRKLTLQASLRLTTCISLRTLALTPSAKGQDS